MIAVEGGARVERARFVVDKGNGVDPGVESDAS